MATSQTNPAPLTKRITIFVFDLQAFDDVKLGLDMPLPAKPQSLEDALAAVGNDKDTLLQVIYDGLVERATEQAKSDPANFYTFSEDGELSTTPYTGQPVTEEKGKQINGAVLNLAKAMGYDKSLPAEKKRAIKDQVKETIRTTPAILAMITGQAAQ